MKTLFIGQSTIELSSIDSTNSYASELLNQSRPVEGTLVYTFNQQNGRGQRGNKWLSEPNKNGALSYILYPTFLAADQQFSLNKIVCLAAADLMSEIVKQDAETTDIKIKWPNDIYANNKKIAGILIENTLSSQSIKSSIIGIGININQENFPATINATSLKLLVGKDLGVIYCIERLSELLEARYLQLKANKQEALDEEYKSKLYQVGEWKSYWVNSERIEGMITGVSPIGKLQLLLRNEEVRVFDLKEISFTESSKG